MSGTRSVKLLILISSWLFFHSHLVFKASCGGGDDGPQYDYSAYTDCSYHPQAPLYNGGVLVDKSGRIPMTYHKTETGIASPAFLLHNLTANTMYSFSCWVKIHGTSSALLRATISTEGVTLHCIGTVLAKSGCWSFLKGGFVLDAFSRSSILYFQNMNEDLTEISVASASLQPFSVEQWSKQQEQSIRTKRKRAATIQAVDGEGNPIAGANVSIQQSSKDFPFGSAIAGTILGNKQYQRWFAERFNVAVFENELKWYATEPQPGKLNYALADDMLKFVRSNKIMARGHNIFWENPTCAPEWVQNLTGGDLRAAVKSRIRSLLSRYRGQFIHWDVNNEMLHFDFYEQRLGENASTEFFRTAQQADPLATLFMNEFNVVETCSDEQSTVDTYISRLKQLRNGGAPMLEGIGLQGHFGRPNIPLMRAVLDKLASLGLPIWLTEVDIAQNLGEHRQGVFLEEVLREAFAYPSVSGIVLWAALHPDGCYQMCLTDGGLGNLPTGEVVENLLREWETKEGGASDEHGQYSFVGFLGEYKVSVVDGNKSAEITMFLSRSDETKHVVVQL
ncbi:endo-1,4-beta-xylanase 5-like [Zingiber officinale]|uniref:endo-1,4-beta-xylanase 5-like n=1 Tax=Zingiber officinale TaxID=94328 RepID=UPI001C4C1DC2|nr:endo-1,4-beta-xylanase 5-like [Zingiber officinale]